MQTALATTSHNQAHRPTQASQDDLLTTDEAAKELRKDPRTLKNWRCKGTYNLPFVKIGGSVFYRRTVIDDVKANGLRKATKGAA